MTGRVWLPALFVVLLALASRMHGLEHVRQNYDRAFPHGLGIIIRDAIADGKLDQLPRVSLLASINLPNPAGASYFYALLTVIEPSPYVATALNAMLGVLVAAVAFNLTRRLFGTWAAITAGVFAGTSVWASWVSRGAWLQGPIEAMSAMALWLTINGIAHRKPKHLFAAFVLVALSMQTYLVAFGLLAQVTLATVIASLGIVRSPQLRRATVAGLAVCTVSMLAYAGAVTSERAALPSVIGNPNVVSADLQLVGINLDPISHVLRIPSGRDFENTFVETDTAQFVLRDQVSDLRATLVDILMLIGLGLVVVTLVRGATSAHRLHHTGGEASADRLRSAEASPPVLAIMLGWLVLPIFGTLFIANFVMREWKVHVFYLLLTSPIPYSLAGAPFAAIERAVRRASMTTQRGLAIGLSALGAIAILTSWWNANGDIEATVRFPYNHDGLYSLPLKQQMSLTRAIWADCRAVNNSEDRMWLASMLNGAEKVRAGAYRVKDGHTIWQVSPDGGNCVLQIDGGVAPGNAETSRILLPGQNRMDRTAVVLDLFTSQPVTTTTPKLSVNLGWSLLDLQTPPSAKAGETIAVTHAWRVDALPTEPYAAWYFAPFVKLQAPDGQTVVNIDSAPAILGWAWRPGEIMISTVHVPLPPDLPPGDYQLELSLFDPNQAKNAVYFDPKQPGTPIVTIRRAIVISK